MQNFYILNSNHNTQVKEKHYGKNHWLSMHTKHEVSISYGSKVMANVKVDNRKTDRQTDRQTSRTKTICPQSFDPRA